MVATSSSWSPTRWSGCSSPAASRAWPPALALGAASAALLDLHPRRDPAGVGLTNGVVSAGGMGLGVLVSAALVELLPAPRVLPYVALFVLFAIAFAGALLMPEPVAARSRLRLTPQRPSVPRRGAPALLPGRARRDRPRGRSAACSCRSARSSSGDLFHTTNHLVAGARRVRARRLRRRVAQLAFGRSRRGPARPPARWRSPPGMVLIVIAASTGLGARCSSPARSSAAPASASRSSARCVRCRRDPGRASRLGDVGLLRRRLRVALAAGDRGGRARHAARRRRRRSRSSAASSPPSRSSSPSRRGARGRGCRRCARGWGTTRRAKVPGVAADPLPKRVALVVHPTRPVDGALATLSRWAGAHDVEVVQLAVNGNRRRHAAAGTLQDGDVVVAVGGDGTVLGGAARGRRAERAGPRRCLRQPRRSDRRRGRSARRGSSIGFWAGEWTARSLPALAIGAAEGAPGRLGRPMIGS